MNDRNSAQPLPPRSSLTPPTEALERRFRVRVEGRDQMRWLTTLSLAGVATAIVLALIGGLPFDIPMPTHSFGWVEPSCGLTRGSTAIARGDFATAWQYNPAAFVIMSLGVAGILRTIVGSATGRWINMTWRPGKTALVIGILVLIGWWAYQQTNAEFIIHSRV